MRPVGRCPLALIATPGDNRSTSIRQPEQTGNTNARNLHDAWFGAPFASENVYDAAATQCALPGATVSAAHNTEAAGNHNATVPGTKNTSLSKLERAIPMSLISFIMSFGYVAVLIGAVFEGETVLILAGFAVHEGYLTLPVVFICAFCGAMVGDAFFFFLGRYKGETILKRFPLIQNMTLKPQQFITRNAVLFAFVLRFMYGFRHVVPFSVGMSPIPIPVFLLCNALGAAVWVGIFGMGGYLFGDLLEVFLGDLKRYEFKIIVTTVIVLVLAHLFFKCLKFFSRKIIR